MIRKFQRDDINKVADIQLDTNIKAHNFIPAEYWKSNFKSVKEALLLAGVYVYEYDTEIQGFIGLNDEYVEGIFVSGEMQSQGIGKILLNYAKDKRNKLNLNVYQKNARAISFYKREGFEIQHSGLDEATGEKDYVMTWQHKQKFRFGEEVLYMKKSISRIIGVIMLIVAIAFIMFALNHPEKSFPWNNTITWLLYGVYFLVTVVLLIAPKMKK